MIKNTTLKIAVATAVMALSVNAFAVRAMSDSSASPALASVSASGTLFKALKSANSKLMSGDWNIVDMATTDKDSQPSLQMTYFRYHASKGHFDFYLKSGNIAETNVGNKANAPIAILVHAKSSPDDYISMRGIVKNLGKNGKLVKYSFEPQIIKITNAKSMTKSVKGSTSKFTAGASGWSESMNKWSFKQGPKSQD